eukprot:TRINITY_DN10789_c0_g1_i3.p1 TRINITY_DN10789_c0_g1~~TRINITY_DN10789_c0_g1_i3.p1  ORF type:complete len:1116 (+),score=170.30 TRINITY_DN10789_c0_g1_i3:393-3350(+)
MAVFDKHEELEVEVLYRDPVHDFGFFRYNPEALRLTRPAEVMLEPAGLVVNAEIRVVGNDAGEKLQILSGTIARVDRNVPEFCSIYNDENTFYAGAGAGTSGGSSGSPVVNKSGNAVALNAAGQEGTSSAYFLPLDRVQTALDSLRAGKPVPRGTLMAALLFKPFDDLIRIGLMDRHERDVREVFPEATGMLVVSSVLCDQEHLRPGDILLLLEDVVCVAFAQMEGTLDAHVGGTVRLVVCRGGEEVQLEVPVRDLHALIPRSFVELGLDTLHGLGYHAAKRLHLPLDGGVYVARAGFVFGGCGRGVLVTSVGKRPTLTLDDFVKAFAEIPDREYFPLSWYELVNFRRDRTLKTGFAKMSRSWSPLRLWRCTGSNQGQESWGWSDLPNPLASPRPPVVGPTAGLAGGDRLVRCLRTSLVGVRFRTDRRFCTEASHTGSAEGFGILVDAQRGLVLTDRHSVPQAVGDVEVSLAGGAVSVDGEVVFIHPLHNLVVIQCDMAQLSTAKLGLRSVKLAKGAKASLRPGENVHFVGSDGQGNTFTARVTVAAVYLPSGRDEFPMGDLPRFREKNMELVVLADTPEDARGGVLCDGDGVVRALFSAFDLHAPQQEETTEAFGIPVCAFRPLVETMCRQPWSPAEVLSLDVEVNAVDVAALARGAAGRFPKAWLQAVGHRCASQGQVARAVRVHRVLPTGASDGQLLPGDVLLSVNGYTIACALDVEEALRLAETARTQENTVIRKPAASHRGSVSRRPAAHTATSDSGADVVTSRTPREVKVRVFRDGEEVGVAISPAILGSQDDERLVVWAGLVLRRTPRCVLERCGESVARRATGVYVQTILGGSPADSREFMPYCFLLEMGGHSVHELDDVFNALHKLATETRGPVQTLAAPVACAGVSADSPHGEIAIAGSSTAGCDQTEVSEVVGGTKRPWVRVRVLDMSGQEHVAALQSDPLFFPTLELRREECTGGKEEAGLGTLRRRWKCVQH